MPRKCLRWMRAHPMWTLSLLLIAAFLLLNVIAFNHAHAMTHFQEGGTRTASPETLSLLAKARVLCLGVNVPRPVNQTDPLGEGLPFEIRHFQGKGGVELEAWYVPHARAKGLVVLLHGYASCKASLLPQARAFHDLGYTTLLLDCRGSGGSGGNQTTIGVDEAEDLALVVEQVRPSQPVVLYGQSMGSAAILRAIAVHNLHPDAVVIECPFDRLLSTVENRFEAMGLPTFPAAQLLVFWGGVQHGFNGFRHNPAEYARSITGPILLMHGENDPRVTPEQARAIYDNLAGEKQFEQFDKVGHESYILADAERWRRSVGRFLGQHIR